MHVCHFCDSSLEGDYFRNIAAGLTRKGVRVSLVELGQGTSPTWLSDNPGVTYFCLGAAGKLQYPVAVRRLVRFLKDENVDILHTHLFYSGLIGVLTKWLRSKTIVALMRHHTSVVRMLGSRFHVAADKWMAKKADHVLTVSHAAQAYMIDIDHIKRDDIQVVHLGFDFQKLSPNTEDRMRVRTEFGFAENDFVIGYVANFARGKGHVQLIDAFAKIAGEIPQARLFFAGRGNSDDARSATAGIPSDKITFAGWRRDIPACLNAMDLFVQPSLSEAFSQVLIEAMGVGLPVIATDVGGAGEVIENDKNGILIKPDDPAAIHREVARLYHNKPLRDAIAEAGMKSVRENFTAEQMVETQFALYKSWIDKS